MLPVSILATSRMSSTSARMLSPAPCTHLDPVAHRLVQLACPASITWVMPRIPLSGVRISWLVVARNSVFAASALPSALLVAARSMLAARTSLRLRRIVTRPKPSIETMMTVATRGADEDDPLGLCARSCSKSIFALQPRPPCRLLDLQSSDWRNRTAPRQARCWSMRQASTSGRRAASAPRDG